MHIKFQSLPNNFFDGSNRFKRTYTEQVVLSRKDFLGSAPKHFLSELIEHCSPNDGRVMKIEFFKTEAMITALMAGIMINGQLALKGDSVTIEPGTSFEFSIGPIRYEAVVEEHETASV